MKTAEITKATDDFDAVRTIVVVLEQFKKEDQERILRWTIEKIGLNVSMSLSHLNRDTTGTSEIRSKENIASVAPKLGCDIKSFVAKKNPLNDTQFAAVLAYYHMFEAPEKKDAISQQDLLDACRLAGRKRPGIPRITLNNAKPKAMMGNLLRSLKK